MKQYIQQTIRQVLILSIPLLCIGTLATASYTAPLTPPTGQGSGDTAIVPLSTDNRAQEKAGGIALYTFIANGVATFDQDVFFGKQLNAGDPLATTTVGALAVGDVTNTNNSVDLAVNGTLTSLLGLQSDTLKNTTKQLVCAKKDGTIVLCGNLNPSVSTTTIGTTSYCLNIPGATSAILSDYVRDGNGNCSLKPMVANVSYEIKRRLRPGGPNYIYYPSATVTLAKPATDDLNFKIVFSSLGIFTKVFACLPGTTYNGGGCNWNTQVLAVMEVSVAKGTTIGTLNDVDNDLTSLLMTTEDNIDMAGSSNNIPCNTSLAQEPPEIAAATQCTIHRYNNNQINPYASTCPSALHSFATYGGVCSIHVGVPLNI